MINYSTAKVSTIFSKQKLRVFLNILINLPFRKLHVQKVEGWGVKPHFMETIFNIKFYV